MTLTKLLARRHLEGPRRVLWPDDYLTDGCSLFRVVELRAFDGQDLVELEDCVSLDVWLVSEAEIVSLRLVRARHGLVRARHGVRTDEGALATVQDRGDADGSGVPCRAAHDGDRTSRRTE